jgi:hypothetical protein
MSWTTHPNWPGNYPAIYTGGYPYPEDLTPLTTKPNKKEEINMLFAVTVVQNKRADKATVLYEEDEILVKTEDIVAMDANQALLFTGASNAEAILKAKEEKSKVRAIVRQLG